MLSAASLDAIADALETAAGATTSANDSEGGYWSRITAAAEALAGASTEANATISGLMLRTTVAFESIAGTSGAEENAGISGYLKRIVDALEVQSGEVGTASIKQRMVTAAQNAVFAFEAETDAYLAAMSSAPDATRQRHLNTLIAALKADGVWAKLDWLCLLAAHDAQAARLNAINPAKTLTANGTMTFTLDRGYAGNGVDGDLSFGEAYEAPGNLFALNSAVIGVWCNLAGGTAATTQIGLSGATRPRIVTRGDGGNETFILNDGSSSVLRSSSSATGHRTAVREGAAIKRGYFNGALVADLTVAATSLVGGVAETHNSNGTLRSSDRLASVYSGGALTSAEVGSIHSRLNTYLTAIGAN